MERLTQRLVIRQLREADYPEFEPSVNDVQRAHFGGGKQFLDWLISQYSAMDIENGLISFGIFEKQTGKFLGTVGVGDHDDLHEPEIFYHLLPQYRGRGFAAEAAGEVTRWALEYFDIPYLTGTVATDNIPSQRVLERCGYRLVDTRSLLVHVTGERYDFRYYRYDRVRQA